MSCAEENNIRESVKDFYGKSLKTSDDLQTSACTTAAQKMPKYLCDIVSVIHDEVISKYFGCGLVVPSCLEEMQILDLGSGSGRDCYALSKLVGENGFVTGIDMTDEQLEIANRHIQYHTDLFGYKKSNIKFVKGYIENLKDAGVKDDSVDIVISNCVINLCKNKKEVLNEVYRVLKAGGELYFSDVYADRQLSDTIRSNELLWGEGLGGALFWKELFDIAEEIGFEKPRRVTVSSFDINSPELKKLVGGARYASVVYRLFKLPPNTDQSISKVVYDGSVTGHEDQIKFDQSYTFKANETVTVDGKTSAILKSSRFKDKFAFSEGPSSFNLTNVEDDPFKILDRGDSA